MRIKANALNRSPGGCWLSGVERDPKLNPPTKSIEAPVGAGSQVSSDRDAPLAIREVQTVVERRAR